MPMRCWQSNLLTTPQWHLRLLCQTGGLKMLKSAEEGDISQSSPNWHALDLTDNSLTEPWSVVLHCHCLTAVWHSPNAHKYFWFAWNKTVLSKTPGTGPYIKFYPNIVCMCVLIIFFFLRSIIALEFWCWYLNWTIKKKKRIHDMFPFICPV